MLAALNDLDLLAADIGGAYLHAPCREKIYTVCGAEFGAELEGCYAIVVRAHYGLKSSGASWRTMLSEVVVNDLKFFPCVADPDVYMRVATRSDQTKYYEYLLVYTDDLLAISLNPKEILSAIDQHFALKERVYKPPDVYLGATISQFHLPDNPEKV